MTDSQDSNAYDPLIFDARRDLDRVDPIMTKVIMDPATTEEFVRDPSGVLTRLGLHPRTTRAVHDRVNAIFYAALTNTELMDTVLDHFESFAGPTEEDVRVHAEGLEEGEIRNTIELDLAAIEHAFGAPDFLRCIYRILLVDINNRRLLENTYTTEQIDAYVERMVEAIVQRRGIRDEPTLERWDANYGFDTGYGGGRENEIAIPVTAIAVAEVGAAVTVAIPAVLLGVIEPEVFAARALRGDARAIRAMATAGAVMRLAGELLVHANNFERT